MPEQRVLLSFKEKANGVPRGAGMDRTTGRCPGLPLATGAILDKCETDVKPTRILRL